MLAHTRFLFFLGSAALLSATAAPAQNPSFGDRVILDAASRLELSIRAAPPSERKKIKEAVDYLRDLAGATKRKNDNKDLLAFNDNTTAFRGKTLTFEMQLSEMAGDGLQENTSDQRTCTLTAKAGDPPALVKLVLDYTKIAGMVPNARVGDRVLVTFECVVGDAKRGNIATSITRPSR